LISGRLVFEFLRDLSGLIGACLSATAFFRFEWRKAEAASINEEITDDPELKAEMVKSRETLVRVRVLAPNELDMAYTAWGLVLIAISFLISMGLTVVEPSLSEKAPSPPAGNISTPVNQVGDTR